MLLKILRGETSKNNGPRIFTAIFGMPGHSFHLFSGIFATRDFFQVKMVAERVGQKNASNARASRAFNQQIFCFFSSSSQNLMIIMEVMTGALKWRKRHSSNWRDFSKGVKKLVQVSSWQTTIWVECQVGWVQSLLQFCLHFMLPYGQEGCMFCERRHLSDQASSSLIESVQVS